MKRFLLRMLTCCAVAWSALGNQAQAQSSAFSYQGQLLEDGRLATGTYDLRLSLWRDPTGTTVDRRVGAVFETNGVRVAKGIFSISPDFGLVSFGQTLWLELEVRVVGAATYNPPLRPRQEILSAPAAQFAIRSETATRAAVADGLSAALDTSALADFAVTRSKLAPGSVSGEKLESGSIGGSALADGAVTAAKLSANSVGSAAVADGSLVPADLNMGLFGAAVWLVGGNLGTSPASSYLGTADNQSFEVRVNNQRALTLIPNAGGQVSFLGGHGDNVMESGALGSVIVGGGSGFANQFMGAASYSFIGGGEGNSIGGSGSGSVITGGARNTIDLESSFAVIGGGEGNVIADNVGQSLVAGGGNNGLGSGVTYSTIGGGSANGIEDRNFAATLAGGANNVITASGGASVAGGVTLSGGRNNRIGGDADGAAIAGGSRNTIDGAARFAFIAGGSDNAASGAFSFAGGRQAKVQHAGSFVWSDAGGVDFASQRANEFAVRAAGGVRLETSGAGLSVDGSPILAGVVTSGQLGNGAVTLDKLADGAVTSAKVSDGSLAPADLNLDSFATTFWRVGGNSITDPGTQYLGTSNAQPLSLVVNGLAVLRLAPDGPTGASLSAGPRAQAAHAGTFVWADGQGGSFPTTAANEFAVRAGGGVRLETGGQGLRLDGGLLQWDGELFTISGRNVALYPVPANWLETNFVTVVAGNGLTGGGSVALGSSITLDVAATNANEGLKLVQRDGSGSFQAGTIQLSGNLELPSTAGPSQGVLTIGGNPFLHFHSASVNVGPSAGNLTMSGTGNTYVGLNAATATTSGFNQVAVGYGALDEDTSGARNTALGVGALGSNVTGSDNVAVGIVAGSQTTGSNNILIGNVGAAAESNTIRIGSPGSVDIAAHTATYLAGVSGTSIPAGTAVLVDVDGKLGTIVSSRRFKQDIEPMGESSEVVNALRPVSFHYTPERDARQVPQFGLIAEEVEQIAPDLVVHDAEGRPFSVRYEAVNAMLLNEFQRAQQRAATEARKVEEQSRDLAELRAEVRRLGELVRTLATATATPTSATVSSTAATANLNAR